MSKLEKMSCLKEHEKEGCKFAQSNQLQDAQKELKTLKLKIVELEEDLSLQKALHSICIEDHNNEIKQKDAKIAEAEKAVKKIGEMASQIAINATSIAQSMKTAETSTNSKCFTFSAQPATRIEGAQGIMQQLIN